MIIIKREDIRWGEMGATYLYGSQITYHADGHVTLKNPLLASGETLKTWFSSVNYQATRSIHEDAGSTGQWSLYQTHFFKPL